MCDICGTGDAPPPDAMVLAATEQALRKLFPSERVYEAALSTSIDESCKLMRMINAVFDLDMSEPLKDEMEEQSRWYQDTLLRVVMFPLINSAIAIAQTISQDQFIVDFAFMVLGSSRSKMLELDRIIEDDDIIRLPVA